MLFAPVFLPLVPRQYTLAASTNASYTAVYTRFGAPRDRLGTERAPWASVDVRGTRRHRVDTRTWRSRTPEISKNRHFRT